MGTEGLTATNVSKRIITTVQEPATEGILLRDDVLLDLPLAVNNVAQPVVMRREHHAYVRALRSEFAPGVIGAAGRNVFEGRVVEAITGTDLPARTEDLSEALGAVAIACLAAKALPSTRTAYRRDRR